MAGGLDRHLPWVGPWPLLALSGSQLFCLWVTEIFLTGQSENKHTCKQDVAGVSPEDSTGTAKDFPG